MVDFEELSSVKGVPGAAEKMKNVVQASAEEKGKWIGWTINGMPPFIWAFASTGLFVAAISVDRHGGSTAAFIFGVFFFLVYIVAISKHGIGKALP